MLCNADELLRSRGSGCFVVSVGINGNTRFEQHLHEERPECEIHGFDGTLDARKTAAVPPFVHFLPRNFNETTHERFRGRRRISLLKIDCEGTPAPRDSS